VSQALQVMYLVMRRLLPADGGGEQRVWQLIRAMAGLGWRVHVVIISSQNDPAVAERLAVHGGTMAWIPRRSGLRTVLAAARGVIERRPLQEAFAGGHEIRERIAAERRRCAPDLVLVDMLRLLPLASGLGVPVVADIGDLLSRRYWRERRRHHAEKLLPLGRMPALFTNLAAVPQCFVSRFEAMAMGRRERGAWRKADVVLMIGEAERDDLARDVPEKVRDRIIHVSMVGQHEQARSRTRKPDRRILGLLGNLHLAGNVYALQRAVCRHGRALTDAGFALRVVGTSTPAAVQLVEQARRAGIAVELAGFVPDLSLELDGWLAGLALTPVGTGMATKVLDCLAHGVPMIGTAVGFRGYPANPALIVAEDPVCAALGIAGMPDETYAGLCGHATNLYNAGYAPARLRRSMAIIAAMINPPAR
jgi:hypothetical protein